MQKTIFHLLIVGIIFSSCRSEDQKLIGHWHEFNLMNSELGKCFIITESTFSENKYAMGGTNKLTDIENYTSPLDWTFYPNKLISNVIIEKNKIFFGDSIVWKKQNDDLKTFISDFSIGLKIKYIPYDTTIEKFDFNENNLKYKTFVYLGKVKDEFIDESAEILEDKYYYQLNDKLTIDEIDLVSYLFPSHQDPKTVNILLKVDKNTPERYLKQFYQAVKKTGMTKGQIYYFKMNSQDRTVGYTHYY